MRCSYCFYKDEMNHRDIPNFGRMTDETVECLIKRACEETKENICFAFQGGEPTLIGLPFYIRFVYFVKKYKKPEQNITYALQTNGYILDGEWAEFFAANHFFIGISIDGTSKVHDKYRKNMEQEGTLKRVLESVKVLDHYLVEYNILCVVTKQTVPYVDKIYRFFQKYNFRYQQYILCLEHLDASLGSSEYVISSKEYGDFLCHLFDLWYEDYIQGRYISIRYFDNLLLLLSGSPPESCDMIGHCSNQWIIEADGGVYPCDFYVLDEWKLGNIKKKSFYELNKTRIQENFIEESLYPPWECKACRWFYLCRNGCKRLREKNNFGIGKNQYCDSFKKFYPYVIERLERLAK